MDKLAVGILAHVDAGKTTLSEGMLYRRGAIRKLGRVDHRDAFLDTDALERELLAGGAPLKPGAKALLAHLRSRGIKTAIATSSTRERAIKLLDQHNLRPSFDAFVFGDEIRHGKPAPDVFLLAAEKLAAPPPECLVLEDSEAGIRAAHAAGIPVICVPDLKMPGEECRKLLLAQCESLNEVAAYFP